MQGTALKNRTKCFSLKDSPQEAVGGKVQRFLLCFVSFKIICIANPKEVVMKF